MKKLIFLLLFTNSLTYAQENIVYLKDVDNTPVLSICSSDIEHNKNCFINTLNNYVANKLILPFDSLNNPIEGKVKAYLVFDKRGNIQIKAIRTNNKILQKSTQKIFDNFPKFSPAVLYNKKISMVLVFPIKYTFSTDPDKFYNINEVSPPQLKLYKKKKTLHQLKNIYEDFINNFITKSNIKGHTILKNTQSLTFSFEIDTLGRMGNFKDIIKPNSSYEKYFNKRALKKRTFFIPAKIGNKPVKIRDTVMLIGIKREVKSLGYSTQKIGY